MIPWVARRPLSPEQLKRTRAEDIFIKKFHLTAAVAFNQEPDLKALYMLLGLAEKVFGTSDLKFLNKRLRVARTRLARRINEDEASYV